MSQCDQILAYMMTYGSITPAEAFTEIGCFRLAARISDLRKRGYSIKTGKVRYATRSGKSKSFACYKLEEA